jgi:hypothetical protein
MITLIKTIHTLIWAVMAAAVFYVFYAGITKTFGVTLWLSIGLIFLETAVLLINKWACPLTPVAMKYTSDRRENFDIYLPEWLAKHNKMIFTTIFVTGLILVVRNILLGPK